MDRQSVLQALFAVVVSHSPLLVAYFIGTGLALGNWNRHRWAPPLLLGGCLVLAAQVVVLGTINSLLPALLQRLVGRPDPGHVSGGWFPAKPLLRHRRGLPDRGRLDSIARP